MGNNPAKRKGRKTDFQKFESLMAKCDYMLKQREKEEKAKVNKESKGK